MTLWSWCPRCGCYGTLADVVAHRVSVGTPTCPPTERVGLLEPVWTRTGVQWVPAGPGR